MTSPRRLALPLGVALVAGTLSVVLTGPVQSSPAAAPTVARAEPRGVVKLSAPIVQPGRRTSTSTKAKLVGTIAFTPRHQGRPVLVQRQLGTDGPWERIARRRQDGTGKVTFTAGATNRSGIAYGYRGIAKPWRGEARVVSEVVSAEVWGEAFRDEFDRRRLGPHWRDRVSRSPSRKCSKVGDRRASHVRRGTLRLQVKLNPNRRQGRCRVDGQRHRYYLNGQVSTQHLAEVGAFTRGTFAARIKFQEKRGQHGGFWMQPLGSTADMGSARDSGAEIDIAEFFGKGYPEGGFASFLYNYGIRDRNGDPKKIGGLSPKATRLLPRRHTWWNSYHVVSLHWTKRAYVFMVDGQVHYRTRRGVTGQPEYLILSLLSSDWELTQAKNKGIRPGGTMKVDWVRVWQR